MKIQLNQSSMENNKKSSGILNFIVGFVAAAGICLALAYAGVKPFGTKGQSVMADTTKTPVTDMKKGQKDKLISDPISYAEMKESTFNSWSETYRNQMGITSKDTGSMGSLLPKDFLKFLCDSACTEVHWRWGMPKKLPFKKPVLMFISKGCKDNQTRYYYILPPKKPVTCPPYCN
ncbi:MAG: hypothetical protein JNL57_07240 [Bacteroidetes bacterium]|nr:hypothetical protein [Bacteroidota bacterium]